MTKQTTQELQAILDGAPEGATFYARFMQSKLNTYAKKWYGEFMFWDESLDIWTHDGWEQSWVKAEVQSLDDIREILELRKEVERLQAKLAGAEYTVNLLSVKSKERIAELEKELSEYKAGLGVCMTDKQFEINNLEQQAKSVEDFISEFYHPELCAIAIKMWSVTKIERLRNQAKALKEQVK